VPVINKAITTPVKANGIENMITNGILNDSNWDAITINTNIRLITINRPRSHK
jgi:hypothetical protein